MEDTAIISGGQIGQFGHAAEPGHLLGEFSAVMLTLTAPVLF